MQARRNYQGKHYYNGVLPAWLRRSKEAVAVVITAAIQYVYWTPQIKLAAVHDYLSLSSRLIQS